MPGLTRTPVPMKRVPPFGTRRGIVPRPSPPYDAPARTACGVRGNTARHGRQAAATGQGDLMADDVQGLTVGTTASYTATVTQEAIASFGQVTGDTNPLHTDADYATRTRFKQPIAHGMFGAGAISAAIGTKLQPEAV